MVYLYIHAKFNNFLVLCFLFTISSTRRKNADSLVNKRCCSFPASHALYLYESGKAKSLSQSTMKVLENSLTLKKSKIGD